MRVGSLFTKIFLWFWFAMLLVSFTLGLAMWLTRPDFRFFRRMDNYRDMFHAMGIVDLYERGELDEMEESRPGMPPFPGRSQHLIVDESKKEILGRSVDNSLMDVVESVQRDGKAIEGVLGKRKYKARAVFSDSGKHYTIICFQMEPPKRMPRPFSFMMHGHWTSLLLRLVLLLCTTFFLCYGLTLYFTNPILRLQKAARALAQGKLGHRIEADMAGRQDELVDLAQDFDIMAERVQELLSTQRRLLGDISHELRTPLTRLNVALELARESSGSEAEEHLDRIEREANRLQELIGRIVTLVRLETGGDHFTSGSLDLGKLVEAIVADTQIEAKGRKCTIHTSCNEFCSIFGSRELLRRAVENVLRNALRHTPEKTSIEVSCTKNEKNISIVVRDHGTGVDEAQLEKLFEPFYRCEEARERSRGGVGLGLAIVKRAIEFHNGSVKAENCEDGGLRVTLQLPAEQSAYDLEAAVKDDGVEA